MKKTVKNKAMHYMLLLIMASAISVQGIFAQMSFEQSNQQQNNNSEQVFGNQQQNTLWGENEVNAFGSEANQMSGTRSNAPALPDEPGASCVPVPDGFWLMLGIALVYGIVVVSRRKEKVI